MNFKDFNNIHGKYEIILADPAWSYKDKGCNGNAESQYATMCLKDICALPVKDIASDNCVLFLWATYPLLQEALQVINAWGFKYKSIAFQWVKLNRSGQGYFFGLGRWTRGNTEPCLLAVKGKPKRIGNDVSQLIVSRIRKHSQKPSEQYCLIEQLLGKRKRIELFARGSFQGWDCWGDQVCDSKQKLFIDCGDQEKNVQSNTLQITANEGDKITIIRKRS